MIELPTLPSDPVCPAASPIAGACPSDQGVVCRVMERDVREDPGVEMSAGELGQLRNSTGGVYLNLQSDPATVTAFCHGDSLPVLTDDDDKALARASYTRCPVWQEWRDAQREGRDELVVEAQPEPVAMGVSSSDAENPWQVARAGLEELAPTEAV